MVASPDAVVLVYTKNITLTTYVKRPAATYQYCRCETRPTIRFICLMAALCRQHIVNEWKRSSGVDCMYPSRKTADEITDSADEKFFDCVLRNVDHVLHELLSKRVDIAYNLGTRCHDRTIPEKKGYLVEQNFITALLYEKRGEA